MSKYTELIRQEYGENNCVFSAGLVEGYGIDTVYLKLEKDGTEPTTLLFTPDEIASIGWCCIGVVWSGLVAERLDQKPQAVKNQSTSKLIADIANELYDVWVEAKSKTPDDWDNVNFNDIPENHKDEYYKTAKRIICKVHNEATRS